MVMPTLPDARRLLRPLLPKEDQAPAPTLDDMRAALARMTREKGEAQATLSGASARRDELIDGDAPDAEILALEAAVDGARLKVERIERLMPELVERVSALEAGDNAEKRAALWRTHQLRLAEVLYIAAAVRRQADDLFDCIHTLKLRALNDGFAAETAIIPLDNNQLAGAHHVLDLAGSILNVTLRPVPAAVLLWNVRFLQFEVVALGVAGRAGHIQGYLTGQEAGFEAEDARWLIDNGKAELADPKPLPPRPAKKQPTSRRTADEQRRFDEAQDGGRRELMMPTKGPLPPEHPRAWAKLDNLPGGF